LVLLNSKEVDNTQAHVKNYVLITGGSGLIGTHLTALLTRVGFSVTHLSRAPRTEKTQTLFWSVDKHQISPDALKTRDTIVHLAGTNIGDKRWTERRKQEILRSRVDSTRLLYDELKSREHEIKTFVSASAIGYYGTEDSETFITESRKPGSGFLADVVRQWEEAVDEIATLGIRVVKIRTGIPLTPEGGVLKELAGPVKYYVAAPLGSGKQFLSWIHIDDLVNIYVKAIQDKDMHGPYNAVAPNPVTNREFIYQLAKAMKRPVLLPHAPAIVLKIMFGEMAELVLKGAKISSQKIQAAGYQFRFYNLEDALRDLLSKE
jgi:uncharacterized protein (TIGR01777 family)